MNNTEKAKTLFEGPYNCSQSVFTAYSEKFGIKENEALKISAGFGGGIARTQELCGALAGGIMVLGCKFYDTNDPGNSKEKVIEKSTELLDRFKAINKTTRCIELTGIDFSTDMDRKLFKELRIQEVVCSKCITDVCNILEDIL